MFYFTDICSVLTFTVIMTRLVILLAALCAIAYGCPNIISKSAWGGRRSTCKPRIKNPVPWVIIHHTTGPSCNTKASCINQVKGIQNHHMNANKWCDVGYNFLVGNDGNVYEGVGWTTVGAHARGSNSKSIGISFIGNYMNNLPSPAAINAAQRLISCGVSKKMIRADYTLKGHRNVFNTACPGNALYNNIKTWGRFKA
ncbi:peptidoglycan-recognition protein SC2-like [Mixophyes fleayi]|uniref:peptidoglycan-recognition protein SC2-like n=1 Tax=Mixophyes fleayi TaxID=3061075 RepID=UPI003F4E40EE